MNANIALELVPKSVCVYTLSKILSSHRIGYETYLFCLISKGNDFVQATSVSRIIRGDDYDYRFTDLFRDVKRYVRSNKRRDYAQLFERCNRNSQSLNADTVVVG